MINYAYRNNKYGNSKTTYDRVIYDSKLEACYAMELDLRLRAKDIKNWIGQVPIEIRVNGKKICVYRCDFEITHIDGKRELVEIKGKETDVWKLKKKLLDATHLIDNPKVKFTILRKEDINTKLLC